jgi:hypothetical protein
MNTGSELKATTRQANIPRWEKEMYRAHPLLEEIFSNNHFSKISETWKKDPLKECSRQCGKVDRFNEQFK